jgi:hypothetical protein
MPTSILETEQDFRIGNERTHIQIPKIFKDEKRAYNKAYSLLRVWPEVDFRKETLTNLMKQGYITKFQDIIALLVLEKKLYSLLQGTNVPLWIETIHDGFKSGNDILRCSDIFSSKKGWNLEGGYCKLSSSDIDFFGLTPEDVCYISLRLGDILPPMRLGDILSGANTSSVVGASASSVVVGASASTLGGGTSYNNQFLYVSHATFANETVTMKMSDISMSKQFTHPLLCKMGQYGIDIHYFYGVINIILSSNSDKSNNNVVSNSSAKLKDYITQNNTTEDIFIIKKEDKNMYEMQQHQHKKSQQLVQTFRPLPYPIILNPETMERLEFHGEQGEATMHLANGRYKILIFSGNRTAKLFPIKDFQWNDVRYLENTKTGELYEKEKDKIISVFTENAHLHLPKKYYKPKYQERHVRPSYFYLYHPSSKTSVIPFISFLNIHIDAELQDAFFDLICNSNLQNMCLVDSCILYRMCYLLWNIYVRRNIPPALLHLNREISFDYGHFAEKIQQYTHSNDSTNDLTNDATFHLLMNELYKKIKWHCS